MWGWYSAYMLRTMHGGQEGDHGRSREVTGGAGLLIGALVGQEALGVAPPPRLGPRLEDRHLSMGRRRGEAGGLVGVDGRVCGCRQVKTWGLSEQEERDLVKNSARSD